MKRHCLHTLTRLWNRYNPRRTTIELDDELVVFLAQLGYVELYRGEYSFTPAGREMLNNKLNELEKASANFRPRNFIRK